MGGNIEAVKSVESIRQGPVEEGSVKIETINLNYLLIKQTGNYCSVSAMDYKLKWTPNELLLNLSEDKQCRIYSQTLKN